MLSIDKIAYTQKVDSNNTSNDKKQYYSPCFKRTQNDSFESNSTEAQHQQMIKNALNEQAKAQKKNKRAKTISLATSGILTAAILASVVLMAYQTFGKKVPKSVFTKISDNLPALTDDCVNPKVKDFIQKLIDLKQIPKEFVKDYDANICNNFAIFHGTTGTGKTFSGKLLAKELNAKYTEVQFSDLSSKYVGETSVFITQKFAEFKKLAKKNPKENFVVVFNEVDSLLLNLANEAGNTSHLTQNRTAFLNGLDSIKDLPNLMVVGTTNVNPNLGGLDSASLSRIGNNIFEIELPTLKEIIGGLKHHLKGKKGAEKLLNDTSALNEIGTMIHNKKGAQRDVSEIFNSAHQDFVIDCHKNKATEFTKQYIIDTINNKNVWAAATEPKVQKANLDESQINPVLNAIWNLIAKMNLPHQ